MLVKAFEIINCSGPVNNVNKQEHNSGIQDLPHMEKRACEGLNFQCKQLSLLTLEGSGGGS